MSNLIRGKLPGNILLQPYFHITVDNKDLQADMEKYIEEVVVTEEEDKLTVATVTVNDYDNKWRNAKGFTNGKNFNIRMGYIHKNKVVLWGRITHIEADFGEDGSSRMTFHVMERAVDMMKVRYSKVFKDVKVTEVITYLHTNAGIQCEVEDTKTVFEFISLQNETGLEFINKWRDKLGWKYYKKEDGTYYFGSKGTRESLHSILGYRTGNHIIKSFHPFYRDLETEEKDDVKEVTSQSSKGKPEIKKSRHKPYKKPGKTNVKRVTAKKK